MAESSHFMNPISPHFNDFFLTRHNIYLASVFSICLRLNHKYTGFSPVTVFACFFNLFNVILPLRNIFNDYEFILSVPSLFQWPHNDRPSQTISDLHLNWTLLCNPEILMLFSDFQGKARWIFPWVSRLWVRKDKSRCSTSQTYPR